jgi:type IX secretion system PorP/SprF family membrane protein
VLGSGYQTSLRPDLSAGVWVYGKRYYLGISGSQLLRSRLDFGGAALYTQSRLQHHYLMTAGYRWEIMPDISFVPSLLIKWMQPAPLSVDATARFIYRDRLWLGGNYRKDDAVMALVGFSLNYLLDISYSYDLSTSPLREYSRGSHELLVGIRLNNRGRVICPQQMW